MSVEKILYVVESNDYGNLWKSETGGVFTVSSRDVDYPTDADAYEAAIEYARTVSGNGMRTRVIRKSRQVVFASAPEPDDIECGLQDEKALTSQEVARAPLPAGSHVTASQPKMRLPLPDLPIVCPSCGEEPRKGDWPITTSNNQLAVSCPACWAIVAPVVAVKADED